MADYSWLWLNDELSDVKIRLVCMGAHAQPPAAQQMKQAAGQVQTCDGHIYATGCAHGQLAATCAMRDPMHDAMPTAVGGKALDGEQEKESCIELPAHAAVLASESGYWKARLLRWQEGMTTQAAAATGAAAASPQAPAAGVAEEGQSKGGQGSRRAVCVDAVTVATIASAAPSPQTPTQPSQSVHVRQMDTAAAPEAPSVPATTAQSGLAMDTPVTPAAPALSATPSPPRTEAAQPGIEKDAKSEPAAALPTPTTPQEELLLGTATTSEPATPLPLSPTEHTAQLEQVDMAASTPAASTASTTTPKSELEVTTPAVQAGQQAVTAAATATTAPPPPAAATATPPVPKPSEVQAGRHAGSAELFTAASESKIALPTGDRSGVLLEHFDNLQELLAAGLVLRYAYTRKLLEDAAPALLLQMTLHADRWDMPQALEACLNQAAGIVELDVPDVNMLLDDDLPFTITTHAAYQSVVNNCIATLMKLFGRAQAAAAQLELLNQFCSLSLKAVQLWAEQDALKVDSENTVAVLFTYWWHSNSSGFDEQQAAAAITVLTESIIADQVTRTFLLDTLEVLPWFKPTSKAVRILKLLHGGLWEEDASAKSKLPTAWSKKEHMQDAEQETVLEWVVTKQDLGLLHEEAGKEEAWLYSNTSLYWHGYRWQLALTLEDQQSPLFVGTTYSSAMPGSSHETGMAPVLRVTFDLMVVGQDEPVLGVGHPFTVYGRDSMHSDICGSDELLGVVATTAPRTNSYPPDKFWKDGKLHIQLKMKDVQ